MGNFISNRQAVEELEINPALIDAVFSALPTKLDKFEKTIYIYSKLCLILSYDAQYWATENDEYVLDRFKRHADLNSIATISPNNSEVVCVDFNLIFSKMLLLAGIKSHTYSKGHLGDDEALGFYHTDVLVPFKSLMPVSDALAEFDIEKLVLTFAGYYDMNNIKLFGKVTNVDFIGYSENSNEVKKYIDSTIERITHSIYKEKIKQMTKDAEKRREKLKKLQQKYEAIKQPSFPKENEELINNFFEQISNQDFDTFPDLLLSSKLFKETLDTLNSQDYVAKFSIVKERDATQSDLFNMIGLIALGQKNDPTFIKYAPPAHLEVLTKQDLQTKFNKRDIDYISNLMPRPKHLVPHIYSPYLEMRYNRLFKKWKEDDFEQSSTNSTQTAGYRELEDYYNTWHK